MAASINPYLREYNALSTYKEEQWTGKRKKLVDKYGYAIPTSDALNYIVEETDGHLAEYGAGVGYWSAQLEKRGQPVTAYDVASHDGEWTEVVSQDVQQHTLDEATTAVLLVWPPASGPVGVAAVEREPQNLYYVGEQSGGCTGTERFFEELDRVYTLEHTVDLPSYTGVDDSLYHFSLRSEYA